MSHKAFWIERKTYFDWTGRRARGRMTRDCVETKMAEFATVTEAEKRARLWTKRFACDVDILTRDAKGRSVYIATTLLDPLDRIWTQVAAAPGQLALL